MENLEKDLNEGCKCCPECACGDNCHCTEDNKCSDECTCGTGCKCHDGEKCDCGDNCTCGDDCTCGDHCKCSDEEKCNEDCACDEQSCDCNEHCTCGDDCDCTADNKCCEECDCGKVEVEEDAQDVLDDEQCKCGCGEKLEESTADAYFKQLLSLRAEFDNYRKRTQNDISKAYSNGFNQAITEFLPALDSFKMATEYITDPNTLMGIQYIEKGILSTLEKIGVKAIDVSGKFDPNFHQAIGSEVSAEHESGDIIKECFKGFTMGDKVIRYSQVIVCK